jgi:hypothetical protein
MRSATSGGSRRENGGRGIGSGIRSPLLRRRAADIRERDGAAMRIQGLPHTRSVPTFTLALTVRLDAVPDDDTIDSLGATLLPAADDLMVWRDADPAAMDDERRLVWRREV